MLKALENTELFFVFKGFPLSPMSAGISPNQLKYRLNRYKTVTVFVHGA
jgi:hypothetical protein